MNNTQQCPGCGLIADNFSGPTHEYIGASSGCWQIYGQLLAKEYEKPEYMQFHRFTVDTYSVQHPGVPEPRAIQSVNIHLVGIFLLVEEGKMPESVTKSIDLLISGFKNRFQWLEPPTDMGNYNVKDILQANSSEEHGQMVKKWAQSTWESWEKHHKTIKNLAKLVNS